MFKETEVISSSEPAMSLSFDEEAYFLEFGDQSSWQDLQEELFIDMANWSEAGEEVSMTIAGLDNLEEVNDESSDTTTSIFIELKNDANETIHTLSSQVSAENFGKGVSLVQSAFSLLGSLMTVCGPVCMHTLSAVTQTSTSLSAGTSVVSGSMAGMSSLTNVAAGGVGTLATPGLTIDGQGNLHLSTPASRLSHLLGVSESDLLSGTFSVESIFAEYFTQIGMQLGYSCGFGLLGELVGVFTDFLVESI